MARPWIPMPGTSPTRIVTNIKVQHGPRMAYIMQRVVGGHTYRWAYEYLLATHPPRYIIAQHLRRARQEFRAFVLTQEAICKAGRESL